VTAGRVLTAFLFYVVAADFALGMGFVGAVGSPVGFALLALAGTLLALDAVRAARAKGVPRLLAAARVLLRAGAAIALVGIPASLALRGSSTVSAGEGQSFGGNPPLRFGEVTLAPRGPHLLSKTVEVVAAAEGQEPVRIGLFPPTSLVGRQWSVFRFGYAPGLRVVSAGGETVTDGFVKLGTMTQSEETASLVQWTPEENLMMGAGTFPPRLEDLVSPPGSGLHVFLRMVEATLGGVRRDLRDPDAYRWLLDGRPEQPAFEVQVFRGRERVYAGRLRAGEEARFDGGAVSIAPEVRLWVDLIATTDPFLPVAITGLALFALGAVLRAGLALAALTRRRAAAPPRAPPAPSPPGA